MVSLTCGLITVDFNFYHALDITGILSAVECNIAFIYASCIHKLLLCLIVAIGESDRAVGREFFVLFLDNDDNTASSSQNTPLKLYVSAANKDVSFTVTILSYIGYSSTRTGLQGSILEFDIPRSAVLQGTTLRRQGRRVLDVCYKAYRAQKILFN